MKLSLAEWRRLARVGKAASDEASRSNLTKLHLRLAGGRLIAEATNSYIMARASAKVDEPKSAWHTLISARQALLVEKDVRSLDRYQDKKRFPDSQIILEVTVAEEWIDVTLADDGTLLGPERISRRLERTDPESFPNVGSHLDDAHNRNADVGINTVMFDAELFDQLRQTSPAMDGYPLVLQFATKGPIAVSCEGGSDDWRGALMPLSRRSL